MRWCAALGVSLLHFILPNLPICGLIFLFFHFLISPPGNREFLLSCPRHGCLKLFLENLKHFFPALFPRARAQVESAQSEFGANRRLGFQIQENLCLDCERRCRPPAAVHIAADTSYTPVTPRHPRHPRHRRSPDAHRHRHTRIAASPSPRCCRNDSTHR